MVGRTGRAKIGDQLEDGRLGHTRHAGRGVHSGTLHEGRDDLDALGEGSLFIEQSIFFICGLLYESLGKWKDKNQIR